MSSHYSQTFKPSFTAKCYNAARRLMEEFEEVGKGYPVLCYTGFSGVTAATMLAAYLTDLGVRVEQMYIRKPREKSHGSRIEFSNRNLGHHAVPIFVDDFVDSGKTHCAVRKAVADFHEDTFVSDGFYARKYEDWDGFYYLHNLRDFDTRDDEWGWEDNMMGHVLIGDTTLVDIRSELWEDDLPYLTEEAA